MPERGVRRVAVSALAWALAAHAFAASGYHVVKKIRVPSGEGAWDHATVDEAGRRLFVAREGEVDVVNLDTGALEGPIGGLKGARAVAVAPDAKRGFIANADGGTVTVFDLGSLKKLSDVPAAAGSEFVAYDPSSKRVLALNAGAHNATVINAADGTVAGTIEVDGSTAIADGSGQFFVALKDKGAVARVDPQKLTVGPIWPVADCERPSGLALDKKSHRLFVGCRNLMLYVVDSDKGRVITQFSAGENIGSVAFDPASRVIFVSSEDGLITVARQEGPDAYRLLDTLYTKPGSRTMAFDSKTHQLFVPSGDLEKAAAGGRKKLVAGTFGILVVGK
jgi:DNA-binding beta-propeller fold protein YncE